MFHVKHFLIVSRETSSIYLATPIISSCRTQSKWTVKDISAQQQFAAMETHLNHRHRRCGTAPPVYTDSPAE